MGLLTNIFQTDLMKGLSLTIRYFFSKPVTLRYPEVYYDLPERFRGGQILNRHEDGKGGQYRLQHDPTTQATARSSRKRNWVACRK